MDSQAGSGKRPSRKAKDGTESTCGVCGLSARRAEAQFCSNCGGSLEETYLPANALRASYGLRHPRSFDRHVARAMDKPVATARLSTLRTADNNGASTTGLAFVTYALVPYLGILFCPGAVLMGGLGLYKSYRVPERGGRRDSYISLTFGLIIFGGQILLWWILYKMPEWAGRF